MTQTIASVPGNQQPKAIFRRAVASRPILA